MMEIAWLTVCVIVGFTGVCYLLMKIHNVLVSIYRALTADDDYNEREIDS
jgi:hypothetical protein